MGQSKLDVWSQLVLSGVCDFSLVVRGSHTNPRPFLPLLAQDRSTVSVVAIYCQPASEVVIDQADHVITSGTTGLSLSCPVGREIVYGFALQRYESTTGTCLPNGFTVCTPGATSCTQTTCVSGIDAADASIMYLVCAPIGDLVDSANPPVMVSDSAVTAAEATDTVTAACPSGYTGAWGQTIGFPDKDGMDGGDGSPGFISASYQANKAYACHRAGARGCGYEEDSTCSLSACERSGYAPHTTFAFMLCYPSARVDVNAGRTALLEIGLSGGAGAPVIATANASSSALAAVTVLATMYGSATAPVAPPGLASTTPSGTGGGVNLQWLADLEDTGGAPAGTVSYEAGAAPGPCPDPDPAPPAISTRGLVLHLDAGDTSSYSPGTHTWKDLSGNLTQGSGGQVVGTNARTWRPVQSVNVDASGAAEFTGLGLDSVAALRLVLHARGARPPVAPLTQAVGVYSVEVLDADGKRVLCGRCDGGAKPRLHSNSRPAPVTRCRHRPCS